MSNKLYYLDNLSPTSETLQEDLDEAYASDEEKLYLEQSQLGDSPALQNRLAIAKNDYDLASRILKFESKSSTGDFMKDMRNKAAAESHRKLYYSKRDKSAFAEYSADLASNEKALGKSRMAYHRAFKEIQSSAKRHSEMVNETSAYNSGKYREVDQVGKAYNMSSVRELLDIDLAEGEYDGSVKSLLANNPKIDVDIITVAKRGGARGVSHHDEEIFSILVDDASTPSGKSAISLSKGDLKFLAERGKSITDLSAELEGSNYDALFGGAREQLPDGSFAPRDKEAKSALMRDLVSRESSSSFDEGDAHDPTFNVNKATKEVTANARSYMMSQDDFKVHAKEQGFDKDQMAQLESGFKSNQESVMETHFEVFQQTNFGNVAFQKYQEILINDLTSDFKSGKLSPDASGDALMDSYFNLLGKVDTLGKSSLGGVGLIADSLSKDANNADYIKILGGATAKELVETSGEYSDAYRKGMIKYLEEVDGNFGHATLNLSVEKLKGWVNTTVGGFAHLASRPFGEDVGVSAEILTKAFSAQGDIQAKVASQGGSAILSDLVAIVPSLASSMYGGRAAVRHMNKELLKDATKVASRGVTGSSIAGGLESFNSTYGEFIAAGKTEKEALAFGALSFIATAGLTKGMGATGFDSIFKGKEGIKAFKIDLAKSAGWKDVRNIYWQYAKAGGKNIVKEGSSEFMEEAADEFVQNLTVQKYLNPDMTLDEQIKNALHAGLIGFIAGAGGGMKGAYNQNQETKSAYQKAYKEREDSLVFDEAKYDEVMGAEAASRRQENDARTQAVLDEMGLTNDNPATQEAFLAKKAEQEVIYKSEMAETQAAASVKAAAEAGKAAMAKNPSVKRTMADRFLGVNKKESVVEKQARALAAKTSKQARSAASEVAKAQVAFDAVEKTHKEGDAEYDKAYKARTDADQKHTAALHVSQKAAAAYESVRTISKKEVSAVAKAKQDRKTKAKEAKEDRVEKPETSETKTPEEIASGAEYNKKHFDSEGSVPKTAREEVFEGKDKVTGKAKFRNPAASKAIGQIYTLDKRITLGEEGAFTPDESGTLSEESMLNTASAIRENIKAAREDLGKKKQDTEGRKSQVAGQHAQLDVAEQSLNRFEARLDDLLYNKAANLESSEGKRRALEKESERIERSTTERARFRERLEGYKSGEEAKAPEAATEESNDEPSGTIPKGEEYSPEQFYKGDKVTFYDRRGVAQHGTFISHGESRGFKYATIKVGLDSEDVNSRVFMQKDGSYDMVHGTNPAYKWGGQAHIEELERKAPFKYPPVNGYDTEQEYRDAKKKYADDVTAWVKVELAKGPSKSVPEAKTELEEEVAAKNDEWTEAINNLPEGFVIGPEAAVEGPTEATAEEKVEAEAKAKKLKEAQEKARKEEAERNKKASESNPELIRQQNEQAFKDTLIATHLDAVVMATMKGQDVGQALLSGYNNPYTTSNDSGSIAAGFEFHTAVDTVDSYLRDVMLGRLSTQFDMTEQGWYSGDEKKINLMELSAAEIMEFYETSVKQIADLIQAKYPFPEGTTKTPENVSMLVSRDPFVKSLLSHMAFRYAKADIDLHVANDNFKGVSQSVIDRFTTIKGRGVVDNAVKVLDNGKLSDKEKLNRIIGNIVDRSPFDIVEIAGKGDSAGVSFDTSTGKRLVKLTVSPELLKSTEGKPTRKRTTKSDIRAYKVLKNIEEEIHHAAVLKSFSEEDLITIGLKVAHSKPLLDLFSSSYAIHGVKGRHFKSILTNEKDGKNNNIIAKDLAGRDIGQDEADGYTALAVETMAILNTHARSGISNSEVLKVIEGELAAGNNFVTGYLKATRDLIKNNKRLANLDKGYGVNTALDKTGVNVQVRNIDTILNEVYGWQPVQMDWLPDNNGVPNLSVYDHRTKNPLIAKSNELIAKAFPDNDSGEIYRDVSAHAASLYEKGQAMIDSGETINGFDRSARNLVNMLNELERENKSFHDGFKSADGKYELSLRGRAFYTRLAKAQGTLENMVSMAEKKVQSKEGKLKRGLTKFGLSFKKELKATAKKNMTSSDKWRKRFAEDLEATLAEVSTDLPVEVRNAIDVLTDMNAFAYLTMGGKRTGKYRQSLVKVDGESQTFELNYDEKSFRSEDMKPENATKDDYVFPTYAEAQAAVKVMNDYDLLGKSRLEWQKSEANLSKAAVKLDVVLKAMFPDLEGGMLNTMFKDMPLDVLEQVLTKPNGLRFAPELRSAIEMKLKTPAVTDEDKKFKRDLEKVFSLEETMYDLFGQGGATNDPLNRRTGQRASSGLASNQVKKKDRNTGEDIYVNHFHLKQDELFINLLPVEFQVQLKAMISDRAKADGNLEDMAKIVRSIEPESKPIDIEKQKITADDHKNLLNVYLSMPHSVDVVVGDLARHIHPDNVEQTKNQQPDGSGMFYIDTSLPMLGVATDVRSSLMAQKETLERDRLEYELRAYGEIGDLEVELEAARNMQLVIKAEIQNLKKGDMGETTDVKSIKVERETKAVKITESHVQKMMRIRNLYNAWPSTASIKRKEQAANDRVDQLKRHMKERLDRNVKRHLELDLDINTLNNFIKIEQAHFGHNPDAGKHVSRHQKYFRSTNDDTHADDMSRFVSHVRNNYNSATHQFEAEGFEFVPDDTLTDKQNKAARKAVYDRFNIPLKNISGEGIRRIHESSDITDKQRNKLKRNDPMALLFPPPKSKSSNEPDWRKRSDVTPLMGLNSVAARPVGENDTATKLSRNIPLPLNETEEASDVLSEFKLEYLDQLFSFFETINERLELVRAGGEFTVAQPDLAANLENYSPLFTKQNDIVSIIENIEREGERLGFKELKIKDGVIDIDHLIQMQKDANVDASVTNIESYAKLIVRLNKAVKSLNHELSSGNYSYSRQERINNSSLREEVKSIGRDRNILISSPDQFAAFIEANWPIDEAADGLKWRAHGIHSDSEITQVGEVYNENSDKNDLEKSVSIRNSREIYGIKYHKTTEFTQEKLVASLEEYIRQYNDPEFNLEALEDFDSPYHIRFNNGDELSALLDLFHEIRKKDEKANRNNVDKAYTAQLVGSMAPFALNGDLRSYNSIKDLKAVSRTAINALSEEVNTLVDMVNEEKDKKSPDQEKLNELRLKLSQKKSEHKSLSERNNRAVKAKSPSAYNRSVLGSMRARNKAIDRVISSVEAPVGFDVESVYANRGKPLKVATEAQKEWLSEMDALGGEHPAFVLANVMTVFNEKQLKIAQQYVYGELYGKNGQLITTTAKASAEFNDIFNTEERKALRIGKLASDRMGEMRKEMADNEAIIDRFEGMDMSGRQALSKSLSDSDFNTLLDHVSTLRGITTSLDQYLNYSVDGVSLNGNDTYGLIGDKIKKEFGNIPVFNIDGRKAPKGLMGKELTQIVLDGSGKPVGVIFDVSHEVTQASGLESRESLIKDLAAITLSRQWSKKPKSDVSRIEHAKMVETLDSFDSPRNERLYVNRTILTLQEDMLTGNTPERYIQYFENPHLETTTYGTKAKRIRNRKGLEQAVRKDFRSNTARLRKELNNLLHSSLTSNSYRSLVDVNKVTGVVFERAKLQEAPSNELTGNLLASLTPAEFQHKMLFDYEFQSLIQQLPLGNELDGFQIDDYLGNQETVDAVVANLDVHNALADAGYDGQVEEVNDERSLEDYNDSEFDYDDMGASMDDSISGEGRDYESGFFIDEDGNQVLPDETDSKNINEQNFFFDEVLEERSEYGSPLETGGVKYGNRDYIFEKNMVSEKRSRLKALVTQAVMNLKGDVIEGINVDGLSSEKNSTRRRGTFIEEGDEFFSIEAFYPAKRGVTDPRLAGAGRLLPDGYVKPTDIRLEDIITGKTKAEVIADRMKAGQEAVFFDAINQNTGEEANTETRGIISSVDSQYDFLTGQYVDAEGVLHLPSGGIMEEKGNLRGSVLIEEDGREIEMAKEAVADAKLNNEYEKDLAYLNDQKESADKVLNDHVDNLRTVNDDLAAIAEINSSAVALREKLDGSPSADVSADMKAFRELVQENFPSLKLNEAGTSLEAKVSSVTKALESAQWNLASRKRSIEAAADDALDVVNRSARGRKLASKEVYYENLQKRFAVKYYQERIRRETKRELDDGSYATALRVDVERGKFGSTSQLADEIAKIEQENEGITFVQALDFYYSRGLESDDVIIHAPILNPKNLSQYRDQINERPQSVYMDEQEKGTMYRTSRFGGQTNSLVMYNTEGMANSGMAPVIGLGREMGGRAFEATIDQTKADVTQMAARVGLANNSALYAELQNNALTGESESNVLRSIDNLTAILADFYHSDAGSKNPLLHGQVETALGYAMAGDLRAFSRAATPVAGKIMGHLFAQKAHNGMNENYKGINRAEQQFMHQDSMVSMFQAGTEESRIQGFNIIGMLDNGLGMSGGRGAHDTYVETQQKKITDMVHNPESGTGTQKASEMYFGALAFQYVEGQVDGNGALVSVREQITNRVKQLRTGLEFDAADLGYGWTKGAVKAASIRKKNKKLFPVLEKIEAVLASSKHDDSRLADDIRNAVKSSWNPAQHRLFDYASEEFGRLRANINVLANIQGNSAETYGRLQDDVVDYLPMSAMTRKEHGFDHLEDLEAAGANNMFMVLSSGSDGRFRSDEKVESANFDFETAMISGFNQQSYLVHMATEYNLVEQMFGFKTDDGASVVGNAFEEGANNAAVTAKDLEGFKAVANFYREQIQAEYDADVRSSYRRGYTHDVVSTVFFKGVKVVLTGLTQLAKQTIPAAAAYNAISDFKTKSRFAHNWSRLKGLSGISFYGEESRQLDANLRTIMSRSFPAGLSRGYNGIDEVKQVHGDKFRFGRNKALSVAHTIAASPNTLANWAFGKVAAGSDHSIVMAIYATELEKWLDNEGKGATIESVAKDPSGHLEALTMARVMTDRIMAQSKASKKGDAFRPQKNGFLDLARMVGFVWTHHTMSQAADNRAAFSIMKHGDEKMDKKRGKDQLKHFGVSTTLFQFMNKTWWTIAASSLWALFDDEEDYMDKQRKTVDKLRSMGVHMSNPVSAKDALMRAGFNAFGDSLGVVSPYAAMMPVKNTTMSIVDDVQRGVATKMDKGDQHMDGGRTFNPKGFVDDDLFDGVDSDGNAIKANWGVKKLAVALNSIEGPLSYVEGISRLYKNLVYAPNDYPLEWTDAVTAVNVLAGGDRNLREGLLRNQELKNGVRHKYSSGKVYSEDAFDSVPLRLQDKRVERPSGYPDKNMPDELPKALAAYQTAGGGEGYKVYKDLDVPYAGAQNDGDSYLAFTNPVNSKVLRLWGLDTPETKYSNSYGKGQLLKQLRMTNSTKNHLLTIGRHAKYFTDQLFHNGKVTIHSTGVKVKGGRREWAFTTVEYKGKKYDHGILLVMKGYAMIGNHVNENMGLPREMPDGRSRADYLNRLREAERYAKINKSGVWSFSRDTGTLGTE